MFPTEDRKEMTHVCKKKKKKIKESLSHYYILNVCFFYLLFTHNKSST